MATNASATLPETRSRYTEAVVTRYVRELFKRVPALLGFRLEADLTVADLTAGNSPPASRVLYPAVMRLVVELAECHPEALQHMRQRSFARGAY